jgi:hypothetical protein
MWQPLKTQEQRPMKLTYKLAAVLIAFPLAVFAKNDINKAGGVSKKSEKLSSVGTNSGGGGDAVLCYSSLATRDEVVANLQKSNSPFDSVDLQLNRLEKGFKPQLLDLYEVGKLTGFPSDTKPVSFARETAESVYARLAQVGDTMRGEHLSTRYAGIQPHVYANLVDYFFEGASNGSQWKAEPLGVTEINDATFSGKFPKNCLIAQVAFYNDQTNVIHYDQRIVSLMPSLHREALRVHEDLYRVRRVAALYYADYLKKYWANKDAESQRRFIADKTSNGVRALVAQLFTKDKFDIDTMKDFAYLLSPHPYNQ